MFILKFGATHNTKKDKIMNGGEQEYKSKRDWCGSAKAFLRPGQCRVKLSSFEYSAAFFDDEIKPCCKVSQQLIPQDKMKRIQRHSSIFQLIFHDFEGNLLF